MRIRPMLSVTALATCLLAGCASVPPAVQLDREMAGVGGKSPLFVGGYRDGCQSGLSAGGDSDFAYAKDLGKANLPDYKMGWEDGFRVCQSRQIQRNYDRQDRFDEPFDRPWFPHTGVSIGVRL